MTREHSEHHKKNHKHTSDEKEDEKLFDFNKSFQDSPEDAPTDQEESTAVLESTISELKEKNLRLLAEFENYKKRTVRERLDLLNSASKELIVSLLPVLGDFERAMKYSEESTDDHFKEGVRLVYNRLFNILQSSGLKEMESQDQTFDAEFHEAITEIPAPDESMKGKILDVIEKGYLLNDKIIRHAKVVVGK
ncbi:MAG: nucleotide exchange factor GrpE [Saprospiraceae bacterium]